ncbi:hypothetical protein HBA_0782 [Sodalis endosymbiont of Henestaris halophilus]|nr:hypothetical protein HBA_0782 [Sodalis endosymbiont of Henestaris halophilus]
MKGIIYHKSHSVTTFQHKEQVALILMILIIRIFYWLLIEQDCKCDSINTKNVCTRNVTIVDQALFTVKLVFIVNTISKSSP